MKDPGYALDTTWRTLLKDLGISSANALRRAGLPENFLHSPNARVAPADYYRLWIGIEAELGDALLPIRLCEVVRSESFSPVLFAAMCSTNLLSAVQRIRDFKPLVAPIRLDVTEQPGQVTIEFRWLDELQPPPASLVAFELLFCATLARMGTREDIRPIRVSTSRPPVPEQAYEDFLGIRIQCASKHCIVFRSEDAIRPFLTSNESLWSSFEPTLRQRLADLDRSATIAQRIHSVLNEALPSGMVSVDQIASKLALSRRTLQRRMEAEGTTYQQLLCEARNRLAQHYLKATALPISEISFLLGYEESNSFYRAFKGWTGMTPEAARNSTSGRL